jgi:hypothetical protein
MQSNVSSKTATPAKWWVGLLMLLACLGVILSVLFRESFDPNKVAFSNDGPLGVQQSAALTTPAIFKGIWLDLFWIGDTGGHAFADVTLGLLWLLGPVGYAKFYEPTSLLLLGICAWVFFRTLKLNPFLCVVGAIAAALNTNIFSHACWGLGSRAITLALVFLALAALNARRVGRPWLNAILAGLAVGMSVVEGADNGAIFSLFVAAYVVVQSFIEGTSLANRVAKSFRLVLVAGFALFIAAQGLISILSLAQKGAVSAQDDPEARERKWTFATQWSLPPAETLRVIIPGLFGYRVDAPPDKSETVYWGRVGEYAPNPELGRRSSGTGEYAGLLVVLLALWAVATSFNKSLNVFSGKERKFIWFWAVMAVIAVLLSWGRFAPFYQFVYALPYFSSIRNPMKFMHPAHMALMILFGYGLLGLSRRYLEKTSASLSPGDHLKSWWTKAATFDKRWTWALIGLTAASALGYLFYTGSHADMEKHLEAVGFENPADPGMAGRIAAYSAHEVGMYVVWLAISCAALLLIMRGFFAGNRAPWAAVLLGLVLTLDLSRGDTPWIIHWNYKYKYATNPIIDILRQKPFEARVAAPRNLVDERAIAASGGYNHLFQSLYQVEWVQQHFQYYNIQSLDVAQDPRPPADREAYLNAMRDLGRYWQLTNTRYVLGMTGFLAPLNSQLDRGRNRFRIVATFDIEAKPGARVSRLEDFTAVVVTNGPLALFEFTGALPRTKLYSQWQVSTNNDSTLRTLTDPAFDPLATVLVSDEIPAPAVSTNNAPGTAEIVSYKPQHIEIRADATAPSVLLLNDRFNKDWLVSVDGQPARLLRCNFIMRGVQIAPGAHTVAFDFKPSLKGLKISLAGIALGGVLCLLLLFVRQPDMPAQTPAPAPAPAAPPPGKTPRK